jgi:hypothetical protein
LVTGQALPSTTMLLLEQNRGIPTATHASLCCAAYEHGFAPLKMPYIVAQEQRHTCCLCSNSLPCSATPAAHPPANECQHTNQHITRHVSLQQHASCSASCCSRLLLHEQLQLAATHSQAHHAALTHTNHCQKQHPAATCALQSQTAVVPSILTATACQHPSRSGQLPTSSKQPNTTFLLKDGMTTARSAT